jgi:serine/threonine-protein kinase SRPK3
MKFIFSEEEGKDILIAHQIDVLGYENFPASWRNQWEQPTIGERDIDDKTPRQPTRNREIWPPLNKAFEDFVQKDRREEKIFGTFEEEETRAILDLIRGMLKFRPEDRLTVDEVLKSEWMVKWALPQTQ